MASASDVSLDQTRYPIGRHVRSENSSLEHYNRWIAEIEQLPSRLRDAVADLDDTQLDTPYRDGGWTVRQLVHHLADSHINSYVRFRLALTEEKPVVKPYDEKLWAELTDARSAPIAPSLSLLEALHHRWGMLLRGLSPEQFARTFQHPENGPASVGDTLSFYAWHGRHHLAHITRLRTASGW